jgi:class 3 adenylate cyclase
MAEERIDTLVSRYLSTEDDLAVLGKKIETSGQAVAIVFVDLAGSTELKHEVTVPRWLGYVVRFLQIMATSASQHGGTLVKRIGDEVMITFASPDAAEAFISATTTDSQLAHFAFKVAADWGTCYPMSFAETPVLDPYGPVVDRAARIAKFAGAGTVLASREFVNALKEEVHYSSLGEFAMKGIPQPQEVFLRASLRATTAKEFRAELLRVLNDNESKRHRFRFVSRHFSASDFELPQYPRAHPFLLRELITLPLLPYGFDEFVKFHSKDPARAKEFLGHIIEWDGVVMSTSTGYGKVARVNIRSGAIAGDSFAGIVLPPEMSDAVNVLKKGDRIRVRAVLMDIDPIVVTLDYADFQLAG